jgi:hypothetical protein
MPCKKKRKHRRRSGYNSVMRMTSDVAKTAIGVSAVTFVAAKTADALKK